jgi:hypothetical protein
MHVRSLFLLLHLPPPDSYSALDNLPADRPHAIEKSKASTAASAPAKTAALNLGKTMSTIVWAVFVGGPKSSTWERRGEMSLSNAPNGSGYVGVRIFKREERKTEMYGSCSPTSRHDTRC